MTGFIFYAWMLSATALALSARDSKRTSSGANKVILPSEVQKGWDRLGTTETGGTWDIKSDDESKAPEQKVWRILFILKI